MFALLLSGPALAATLVVDASGGGDYTDIIEAIGAAADGDTIEVRAGIYAWGGLNWTGRDLSIIGDGPDVVTVRVAGVSPNYLILSPEEGGNTLIEGLSFVGVSDPDSGDEYWPIALEGHGLITIRNCHFKRLWAGLYVSGDYAVVDGCLFEDNTRGIIFFYSGYLDVENSVFRGHIWFGIGGYYGSVQAVSTSVRHSAFVDNYVGIRDQNTFRVVITDNIFVGSEYVPLSFPYLGGQDLTVRNNLFWDNSSDPESYACILGDDIIEADPLFVARTDDGDWTNDDYHLQPGSPAIDAAWSELVDTDIEGYPRPLDGDGDGEAVRDLGAYEWRLDEDADGYADQSIGGDDCDDSDAATHPGADEVCGDGLDQDCDGADETCIDTGDPDSGGEDTGGADTGGADTDSGDSADTSTGDTGAPSSPSGGVDGDPVRRCGCGSAPSPRAWPLALLLGGAGLVGFRARRRRG